MDIHEIKKEQWDKNYLNNHYVTDSDVVSVFNYHQLEKPKGKDFLYIGVGYTDFIRILSEDNDMIGADVSEKALKAVEPYCKATYFSKDINKIDAVDLAMCHLVLQHNHEYEVTRIINDVNLKDDGMFSFQFATLNMNNHRISSGLSNDINSSMLYFYSVDKMKSIVERTNKKILKVIGPYWHGEPFNFDWHIFQVCNK